MYGITTVPGVTNCLKPDMLLIYFFKSLDTHTFFSRRTVDFRLLRWGFPQSLNEFHVDVDSLPFWLVGWRRRLIGGV